MNTLLKKLLQKHELVSQFAVEPAVFAFKVYAAICISVALSLLVWLHAFAPADWHSTTPSPSVLLLLLVSMFFGFTVCVQGRSGQQISDFATTLSLPVLLSFYGPDTGLFVAGAAGYLLANVSLLSITGGYWGASFNTAKLLIENALGVTVFCLVSGSVPFWAALTLVGMTLCLVNMVMMTIDIMTFSNPLKEAAREVIKADGLNWLLIPFLWLGAYTIAEANAFVALIAMFTPTILAYINTKSEEKLVKVERKLGLDPMTGLRNRAEFWREISEFTARADQINVPFTVLMIDIDNFKEINDTYGHLQGDSAIVDVANSIVSCLGPDDFACRYGGEEFAVLLSDTDAAMTYEVAESVRLAARAALTTWRQSVSIGLWVRAPHCGTPKDAMHIADKALYEAKRSGKDRVVIAHGEQDDNIDYEQPGGHEGLSQAS